MNHFGEPRIAGWKTPADWAALRSELLNGKASDWRVAFEEFFLARLNLRYLSPIRVLQDNGTYQGEGFSIVVIQCSLIEFLESTFQGLNYRYKQRGEALAIHEYSSSRDMFVSFLTNRSPFASVFDHNSATEFYIGVRCGLLHEAKTKLGWRVQAKSQSGIVADTTARLIFRDDFQSALLQYIDAYGRQLVSDSLLQEAFVRKFDSLTT